MTEMLDPAELLFFDTFSHESSEELNLDLVQFPKPVYVTEVRIIPLGARVQADFPGGVRLGATNPSQFIIEFFVNDLGKPGASTFESLGGFEYNQNGCIHLECINETNNRQIPTDGLVLRGWYTTITLAVYGTLTKNLAEQVLPQVVAQPNAINQQPPPLMGDVQQIQTTNQPLDNSWQSDVNINPVQIDQYNPPQTAVNYNTGYVQQDTYQQDYHHVEYYNTEPPKDPRYHHTPETEWEQKEHPRRNDRIRDVEDPRDPDRHYTRAHSRDRDRREYREASRDRDWERERAPSMDPREREWDRSYKMQENYKRSREPYTRGISSDREEVRKRPRTPPMISPKRPHTPHGEKELSPGDVESISEDEIANNEKIDVKHELKTEIPMKIPIENENNESVHQNNNNQLVEMEEFEPILSDEDICDEMDNYQDLEYDLSAYSNNDDIIKIFNPITSEIEKYHPRNYVDIKKETTHNLKNKLEQIFLKFDEKILNILDLLTPCSNKFSSNDFKNFSPEIKEEYVHICEQIPPLLQNNPQFSLLIEVYTELPDKFLESLNFYGPLKILMDTLLSFIAIGLDFELALTQNQPPYKIRHIKNGVRLLESCCSYPLFIKLTNSKSKIRVQKTLLELFEKEYMALSIKLLILKSLDSTLNEFGIEEFLANNGYQILVKILKNCNSVRVKFALNSLITKLNIWELLDNFKKSTFELCDEKNGGGKNKFILEALEEILTKFRRGNFEISQPKRFLPVSTQFEIHTNQEKNVFINFMRKHKILECFLILLTCPQTSRFSSILTQIHEFLAILSQNFEGLIFLSENLESVALIIKCFLQTEDLDASFILSETIFIKSQSLGLQMAYKLQALYYIELLTDLLKVKKNSDAILEGLHGLFTLCYVNVGKKSTASVISMGANITPFLELFNFHDMEKLKKGPAIGYIIDLIYLTVIYSNDIKFLERYGKQILALAYQSDRFEPTCASKLVEILGYLRPLEISNVFSYDDIKPLCEIMKNNLDNIGGTIPPQILTSLRILCHLGLENESTNSILGETSDFLELKYKYVILQLFSLDGVANLTKILSKICEFYEQPTLHISAFGSFQGFLIIEVTLLCVKLLKSMLANVIQCRNTDFKDLTSIPILLQTFNLANSYPQTSFMYHQAKLVCEEIINTLLVYTQPVSEEITENESLNKTLWTLMTGEVIKFITFAPYTFIGGLLIFSELLPLPLPVQAKEILSESEIKRLVNLRKLWSAHLHPHALQIHEFITKLSNSVHQPLLHLLRHVCIQISDLAANSALMITRGILDSVIASVGPKVEKGVSQNIVCSANTARLLHFLACLATHNAIKCAILQLVSNPTLVKIDEKYHGLLTIFCQVLKTKNEISNHIQGQECVLNIIQNLCDAEITLVQNLDEKISSEIYLSNSLPSRELLLPLISSLVDHFTSENSFTTLLPCLRTFLLLTEHDFGFYYLISVFDKKFNPLLSIFKRFVTIFCKDNHNLLQTLNTTLEFIKVCMSTDLLEETNVIIAPRNMIISCKELKNWIGWGKLEGESLEKHPLYTLETLLKNCDTDLEALQSISESVSNILEKLNAPESDVASFERTEVILPPSDTLLNQFACRPVYNLTDFTEDRLTTSYWLSSPQDEGESEADLVPCDIIEIWRQNLPADISLNREIERLLKICPTQDSNERNLEQIKTKRIIEQQKDNDKMKRPYVTPMRGRGFPRVPPQRGDLFRSRPPNTSRPPSLHVDDFVALETCGAQPTGPTGYNKISREILSTRVRSVRGRTFISPDRGMHFRPM